MKKALLFVAIILIGGGIFYFSSAAPTPPEEELSPQPESEAKAEVAPEAQGISWIKTDDRALFTAIEDVTGGESTGEAYLLRNENQLYHYVSGQLPNPGQGNAYEGWLVTKSPKLSFFSTGVMEKVAEGSYELEYTSGDLAEGYNEVVITLETEVDETPEKHILEGSF